MGNLLSRWTSKPSTIEILEKLDKDISYFEKVKQSNLNKQRHLVAGLLLYSVLLYILAAVVFFFYYLPEKWLDRVLYTIPLCVFPFVVWLLKRFLHWYFVKRISKNDLQLEDLQDQKKTILEEVMENETYKKAREILEKFDPEKLQAMQGVNSTPAPSKTAPGQELRQRSVAKLLPPVNQKPAKTPGPAPMPGPLPQAQSTPQGGANNRLFQTPGPQPMLQRNGQQLNLGASPTQTKLVRPILPRERSAIDKIVEYLVGDGPQHRYALICRHCSSHNGMAFKEEFEYLSFRCCYCQVMNPARKRRPPAPRIPHTVSPIQQSATGTGQRMMGRNTDDENKGRPDEPKARLEDIISEDDTMDESRSNDSMIEVMMKKKHR